MMTGPIYCRAFFSLCFLGWLCRLLSSSSSTSSSFVSLSSYYDDVDDYHILNHHYSLMMLFGAIASLVIFLGCGAFLFTIWEVVIVIIIIEIIINIITIIIIKSGLEFLWCFLLLFCDHDHHWIRRHDPKHIRNRYINDEM